MRNDPLASRLRILLWSPTPGLGLARELLEGKTSHKTCRACFKKEGPPARSPTLLVFKVAWCDLICVLFVSVWSSW